MVTIRWQDGGGSYPYDLLVEDTGVSREIWDERIWGEVAERDLMFLKRSTPYGKGAPSGVDLHLPKEFPDGDLDAMPNETTEDDAVLCNRDHKVHEWKYKEVAVFPVGYRDICSYCLGEFYHWWDREMSGNDNLPHWPGES